MPGPWGPAIERLRRAKKLTRDTVARRARMTPTTYGRIERGQHTQTRKLQDIADVFGVPIEEVLLIRELPTSQKFATVAAQNITHGEGAFVPAAAFNQLAEEFAAFKIQQIAIEEQLAGFLVGRRRRKHLSKNRTHKSVRSPDARKNR